MVSSCCHLHFASSQAFHACVVECDPNVSFDIIEFDSVDKKGSKTDVFAGRDVLPKLEDVPGVVEKGVAVSEGLRVISAMRHLSVNDVLLQGRLEFGQVSVASDSAEAFFGSQQAGDAPAESHVAVAVAFDSACHITHAAEHGFHRVRR